MARTEWQFEDENPLEPGPYTVKVMRAQPYIPDEEDKTAMVFLDLQVLAGPYAGRIATTKINCPTDEQLAAYKDGGAFHRKLLRGFTAAFNAAALGSGGDDEKYFEILEDSLLDQVVEVELGLGKGAYSNQNEVKAVTVAEETAGLKVDGPARSDVGDVRPAEPEITGMEVREEEEKEVKASDEVPF